jgi:hypothetical protein
LLDKTRLGARFACFKCGTKFYDLGRPVPACPECGADQREAPSRDIRSLLGGRGPVKKGRDDEEVEETPGDDEEDLGLLEDDEEDDDDAPELDEDEDEDEGGGGGGGGGEEDW